MSSEETVEAAIRTLIAAAPAGKSVDPTEVARRLAGSDEKLWSRLMPSIRNAAVTMAEAGEIAILRKGKPVDPRAFKGVYRLGRPG